MNCQEWEERIALYATEDLDGASAEEAARHLAQCHACRAFAGEIRQALELARSAHAQPVAAGHYTAVRARVLARLEDRRRVWRRWLWVSVGGAAALALVAVQLAVRRADKPSQQMARLRPPEMRAVLPAPAAPPRQPARQARPRPTVAPVRQAPGPPPALEPLEPLVVKLVTDDPDVIIYWIADRTGDEK